MARSLSDIRDDIERATDARYEVWRELAGTGWPTNETLVERRAHLDARLRYLWEELREERCKTRDLLTLTREDAVRLTRSVAGLALA